MSYYPESKVEVSGLIAKYYDISLDLVTLGMYASMIRKVVRLMGIRQGDRILDLGAGSGRNACLMKRYLSSEGEFIGLDISEVMIYQFEKKCADFPNMKIVNKRIDRELDYDGYFDKVFISFVLHGFPQEIRMRIIENALKALKKAGEFFNLEYNRFRVDKMPFYLRIAFRLVECPYAFDFVEKDWKKILFLQGFGNFAEHRFFGGYVRLLKGVKAA
jgi:ubiquinone/menaquinone biosynthesis C-methylase UbiE